MILLPLFLVAGNVSPSHGSLLHFNLIAVYLDPIVAEKQHVGSVASSPIAEASPQSQSQKATVPLLEHAEFWNGF